MIVFSQSPRWMIDSRPGRPYLLSLRLNLNIFGVRPTTRLRFHVSPSSPGVGSVWKEDDPLARGSGPFALGDWLTLRLNRQFRGIQGGGGGLGRPRRMGSGFFTARLGGFGAVVGRARLGKPGRAGPPLDGPSLGFAGLWADFFVRDAFRESDAGGSERPIRRNRANPPRRGAPLDFGVRGE